MLTLRCLENGQCVMAQLWQKADDGQPTVHRRVSSGVYRSPLF
ncbi:hypothetical protein M2351_007075 [Azospirillum canadense]|nr:hypothetical protein [Azospirillum canadense]